MVNSVYEIQLSSSKTSTYFYHINQERSCHAKDEYSTDLRNIYGLYWRAHSMATPMQIIILPVSLTFVGYI